jgi:hypothetical protein
VSASPRSVEQVTMRLRPREARSELVEVAVADPVDLGMDPSCGEHANPADVAALHVDHRVDHTIREMPYSSQKARIRPGRFGGDPKRASALPRRHHETVRGTPKRAQRPPSSVPDGTGPSRTGQRPDPRSTPCSRPRVAMADHFAWLNRSDRPRGVGRRDPADGCIVHSAQHSRCRPEPRLLRLVRPARRARLALEQRHLLVVGGDRQWHGHDPDTDGSEMLEYSVDGRRPRVRGPLHSVPNDHDRARGHRSI